MKVLDFIFAARPMLLLPVWSIFLLTHYYNYPALTLSPSTRAKICSITLMTAGIYYLNQYYDYHSDLLNKKVGFLQNGLFSPQEIIAAYLSVSVLAIITSFLVGAGFALLVIAVFIFGFFYSAPPFRLKDRPIAGVFANGIGYGFLLPLSVPDNLLNFDGRIFGLIGYFLLVVSATYLLTIIPDRHGDMASGKNTMAKYMADRSLILSAVLFVILSGSLAILVGTYLLAVISMVTLVIYIGAAISQQPSVILFACKFPILLLTVLAGWFFPTYLIFIVVLLSLTRLYYSHRFGIIYPMLN